jgi:hypothetical protein
MAKQSTWVGQTFERACVFWRKRCAAKDVGGIFALGLGLGLEEGFVVGLCRRLERF